MNLKELVNDVGIKETVKVVFWAIGIYIYLLLLGCLDIILKVLPSTNLQRAFWLQAYKVCGWFAELILYTDNVYMSSKKVSADRFEELDRDFGDLYDQTMSIKHECLKEAANCLEEEA